MIPKIIHQIIGSERSSLVHICMNSWVKLKNKGFKIAYWSPEGISSFIKENYLFAYDAFTTARNHAEAADIARYLIIYHYGGYYVDLDIHLNNEEEFLNLIKEKKNGYFVIDPLNSTIASEHFSSKKGNKYLLEVVKDIVSIYNLNLREHYATPQYSGPYRMRDTFERLNNMSIFFIPVKEVFEYSYDEIRQAKEFCINKAMVHFWEHSWIE